MLLCGLRDSGCCHHHQESMYVCQAVCAHGSAQHFKSEEQQNSHRRCDTNLAKFKLLEVYLLARFELHIHSFPPGESPIGWHLC